ncbi:MAG: hypothetical protein ACQCXQ_06830 [Verrucomicrobiales bacterium]|nr:hypothetical protein [Verrucomicrobiota bacterium JB025]
MTCIFKWLAIALAILSLSSCGLPMAAVRTVNNYSDMVVPVAAAAAL